MIAYNLFCTGTDEELLLVLTHRVPAECLLSFHRLPQSACHSLSPDRTRQMTALLPETVKSKKTGIEMVKKH